MTTLVPSMSKENMYSVNWTHQQGHILERLKTLSDDVFMTDVTLACDGEFIQAHKVVLSLCSTFFRDLFVRNKAEKSNTIIILGNVSALNLKYLLQFIYQGNVHIPSQDVDSFLLAGRLLRIEGLTDNPPIKDKPCSSAHWNTNPEAAPRSEPNVQRPPRTPAAGSSASELLRSMASSAIDETPHIPPKMPRLLPVEPAPFPQGMSGFNQFAGGTDETLGNLVDEPDHLKNDEDFEEESEEECVIDLNSVKTEPIQVYSGFEGSYQSHGQEESFGEDSFEDSLDAESRPIPAPHSDIASSSATAASQARRRITKRGKLPPPRRIGSGGIPGQKKSLVWKYFESVDNNTGRCQVCFKDIRTSQGSTTALRQHLQSVHKETYDEMYDQEKAKKSAKAKKKAAKMMGGVSNN